MYLKQLCYICQTINVQIYNQTITHKTDIMQILKIKLSKDEQQIIYDYLIKHFNCEDTRQFANPEFSDEIECESTLELYTEYHITDENNQTAISNRSVVSFQITFFHDGEEVEVEDWDIEDRIKKYYEI